MSGGLCWPKSERSSSAIGHGVFILAFVTYRLTSATAFRCGNGSLRLAWTIRLCRGCGGHFLSHWRRRSSRGGCRSGPHINRHRRGSGLSKPTRSEPSNLRWRNLAPATTRMTRRLACAVQSSEPGSAGSSGCLSACGHRKCSWKVFGRSGLS